MEPQALPIPSTVPSEEAASSILIDNMYLPGEAAPQDLLLIDKESFAFLCIGIIIPNFLKHDGAILWGQMPIDDGIVPHQVTTLIKSYLLPHVVGKVQMPKVLQDLKRKTDE